MESTSETKSWKGSSISDICRGQGFWNFTITPISPSKYHSVLYEMPADLKHVPKPHHKSQKENLWDEDNVRMPHSAHNLFPLNENGVDVIKQRWDVIQDAYSRKIETSRELEAAIHSYNRNLPSFEALNDFLDNVLEDDDQILFYTKTLPGIVNLALSLPEIVPANIPLLKKNHCRSLSLSQYQIGSLLANAFLCTFPFKKDTTNYYPIINFFRLFSLPKKGREKTVSEKLKCILNYFDRILKDAPKGVVTFERKFTPKSTMQRWDNCDKNLGNTKIHITSSGTIEDNGLGMLQVDFANKNIGGGVLGHGCVQEEIRFVICPELIVSRLFVERLEDNEAVIVRGVERYNNYTGYAETFNWAGNCVDDTPHDDYGRRKTNITVIDATRFNKPLDQFYPSALLRELNKAYVGFHARETHNLSPVATGNWGCGAFRGNAHLKSLLQLMACSATNRDLVYFSFGDADLVEDFYNMHLFLANHQITITQMWRFLCKFATSKVLPDKLYSFIQQSYFDSKKQPLIRNFFGLKTTAPKPLDVTLSIPSTSKTTHEEIPKPEIKKEVFSAPEEQTVQLNKLEFKRSTPFKKRTTPQQIKEQLPKNHVELMNFIDGNANKCETKEEETLTFLEKIDRMRRNSDGTIRLVNERNADEEEMDVDIIPASPEAVKQVKRKITDYFTKPHNKLS